jgi:hypothetical protein
MRRQRGFWEMSIDPKAIHLERDVTPGERFFTRSPFWIVAYGQAGFWIDHTWFDRALQEPCQVLPRSI